MEEKIKSELIEPLIHQTILDNIDLGIRVVDSEAKPIIYNKKMRSIESMTMEDFSKKKITDVFRFKNKLDSRLLQALHHGRSFHNEKQNYFNNKGEEITTINNIFPIKKRGKTIAAVEIAKDITQVEKLIRENIKRKSNTTYTFDNLIGDSPPFKEVIENAKRATRTSSSVLIVGETGTGKELFAQSIHSGSERAAGPFITQNCAALPESLIEGILFGTVKGAFTGAIERPGLFEEAEGGTLLLDEINSLPTSLQAKLLRAIQERKVTRIGETKERPINTRILATINEDPIDAIAEGRLRKDLYYRLSVVTLFIPPLRDRIDDTFPLVETFLRKYNYLFQMNVSGITDGVRETFHSYHWPGNVRELEHVIEGAMNLIIEEEKISHSHLPPHFQNKMRFAHHSLKDENTLPFSLKNGNTMPQMLKEMEKSMIKHALQNNEYNIKRSAKKLGISRQSLQYKLEKFKINKQE
ncbi:sigma-54 interaction domain-containing protein [Bacillus sp. FJAT-44742]|uniref:sigma-54 interaction domain-containing protein n=1 Tax=Bacillus sp. FJAT-44742 TaxID=2014005 RepID=UPI000C24E415|nr:sigma 54-interacting transcriptional regulator [Bacillus sp. FJAT-44742]